MFNLTWEQIFSMTKSSKFLPPAIFFFLETLFYYNCNDNNMHKKKLLIRSSHLIFENFRICFLFYSISFPQLTQICMVIYITIANIFKEMYLSVLS